MCDSMMEKRNEVIEMKRQIPKNVRQIGNVSDSSKIYVEDYVDTFFNQLCSKADQEMVGAFLIGETVQEEEQDYIYVYGAIQMKELLVKGKEFIIEENVWKNACETCKEYFGNAEILGWFIAGGENNVEVNHNIKKIHQKYFHREKSLFITKNARDKEEKFYIYKFRDMMECGGHYVYYEKNLEMQNYMIATRKRSGFTPSEIIEDRVTKNFRNLVREKTEQNEQRARSRMVYAMSTFLVLVVLVIGITMINNYDKMKSVQNSLDKLTQNVSKVDKQEKEGKEEDSVEVLGDIVSSNKEEDKDITGDIQEGDVQEGDTQENDAQEGEVQEGNAQEGDAQEGNEQEGGNTVQDSTQQEQPPEGTTTKTYIVKEGDTLENISRKEYGDITHIEAICKLNKLEDGNLIFIGQKLLLP